MFYKIKNKERFEARKKQNKRIRQNPDDELYKFAKSMYDGTLKREIREDKEITKRIKILFTILMQKDLTELQKKLIILKIQEMYNYLFAIEPKGIEGINKIEINLEELYNLAENKRQIDYVYGYVLVPIKEIDIYNFEKSIREKIEINKYTLLYNDSKIVFAQKYYPHRYDFINIVFRIKGKDCVVLTDYIDKNKTNEFNHQIIAKLTDDYEFCNLSEAEMDYYLHDANYDERSVYIQYENNKDIDGINRLILEYREKWGINNEKINKDFKENKKF
jgi:hypothetical protein